ncbi:MAG: hypothetical protein QOH84_669 [Kribbellaceae bacterium]|nr:hypothetical protein [Kribbellaceae bacterium]
MHPLSQIAPGRPSLIKAVSDRGHEAGEHIR